MRTCRNVLARDFFSRLENPATNRHFLSFSLQAQIVRGIDLTTMAQSLASTKNAFSSAPVALSHYLCIFAHGSQ